MLRPQLLPFFVSKVSEKSPDALHAEQTGQAAISHHESSTSFTKSAHLIENLKISRAKHGASATLHKAGWGRRLRDLLFVMLSLLWILLPRRGRPVRKKALHELHPLSYLDALRGYLALIIFTGHTMSRVWKWIPDSVLSVPWLQFPFRGGFASLEIFFWISGYAVTYRLVGLMQAKKPDRLLDALASSIFRRYFRLFLPILPVTLVTAFAVSVGLAIPPENKADVVKGNPIWWWVKDSAHVLNPFTNILAYWNGESGSKLIDPFWSLSAEFRSSMILFTFCAGTCKLSSRRRKTLIWLCAPAFICWQAQWAAMAFIGMWFAECRQEKNAKQKPQLPLKSPNTLSEPGATPGPLKSSLSKDASGGDRHLEQTKQAGFTSSMRLRVFGKNDGSTEKSSSQQLRRVALIALFLYSFIVLKDPYDTDKKRLFPHNILNLLVPDHWHVQMRMHMHLCIGSVMMLYPLDQLPLLQLPLLTPFSQFLGELSFGIYAVHFPIRWIVWEPRYVLWQRARYGHDAFDSFWVAFPGWFVMGIMVIWAAELFRRLDMQVVKFCKNLELWAFE